MEEYLLKVILKSNGIDIESCSLSEAVSSLSLILTDEKHLNQCVILVQKELLHLSENADNKDFYTNLLLFLIRNYIIYTNDVNDDIIKILKSITREVVFEMFTSNKVFLKGFIKAFIQRALAKREIFIKNEENIPLLMEYDDGIKVDFLNDYLRSILKRARMLFSNDDETIEFIEHAFTSKPSSENAELVEVANLLRKYNNLLMRVIYTDVYEYLLTFNIVNPQVQNVMRFIENKVSRNDYKLDVNFDLETRQILACYLSLTPEKRKSNHTSLTTDDIEYLRRINPLFMIENDDIAIGR